MRGEPSPSAVLDEISRLDREPPAIPTIDIGPAKVGRCTGWAITCLEHGPLSDEKGRPTSVRKRSYAHAAAEMHLEAHHQGRGQIRDNA